MTREGTLRMCDAMTPSISKGKWKLTTVQNMSREDKAVNPVPFSASKEFTVDYTIYGLPPGTVVNRSPLPDSRGAYTDLLAHVVLKDPFFPWYGSRKGKKEVPAVALLMFTEEELEECGGLEITQTTVGEFLKQKPGCIPHDFKPAVEVLEKKTCRSIRISTRLFDEISPTREELPFFSHCRQVYIGDKAEMDLHPEGMFSVAVCSRLAEYRAGSKNRYHLHLVSLEGWEDYLGGRAEVSGCACMELITLEHWSFEVSGEAPLSFRQFAAGLKENRGKGSDMLRLWVKSEPRLWDGFVPLLYHVRTGEEGMCWYRSPLSPVITEKRRRDNPYFTSDAALVYDAGEGVFDVSLAAAWECGRMAALQDPVFCSRMMDLRRRGQGLVDEAEEGRQGRKRFAEPGGSGHDGRGPAGSGCGGSGQGRNVYNENRLKGLARCMEEQGEALTKALEEELDSIAHWLGRLNLLYGVPFHYLVPHPDLLPQESMRFFYMDENWLEALNDGAVSIGMDCSRQSRFNQMIRKALHEKTAGCLLKYRAGLYGQDVPEDRKESMSGMLICSRLVRFWPTLSVGAWDKEGKKLAILRMQILSGNHMLVIFDGIADKIACEEPLETILMKVEPEFHEFRECARILAMDAETWKSPAEFASRFLTIGDRVIFEGGDA